MRDLPLVRSVLRAYAWWRRVCAWWRSHPMVADALWAFPVGLLVLVAMAEEEKFNQGWLPPGFSFVWALGGAVVPLLWRRTRPDRAMMCVFLGCVVQLFILDTAYPGNISALIMLFAVAAYGKKQLRWWWLGAALVGCLLGVYDWQKGSYGASWLAALANYVMTAVFMMGLVVSSFVPGALRRQRYELVESLRERAASLERERDSVSRLAVQEERNRIARDMHDVVAHSLSVIVVQADGAAYALAHGDPATAGQVAERALGTIGDTARGALSETRRLVGVLRRAGDEVEYAPQGGLDRIGDLVAHVDAAGTPATFTVVGGPAPVETLDVAAQMALYRVVQESLTNALKHGGAGVTVAVELAYTPGKVSVAVRDTGGGVSHDDGQGHGLIGMRERIASVGGTFSARPRFGGGFEVVASVPSVESEHSSSVLGIAPGIGSDGGGHS
ncbi:Sensor histidine kinase desK [Dermatophilus congolensis]|uniref:histidine kinase n=1 Tax=Dermatophilus congolensis TaxID=1863 RepID=A0A239VEQ7_9MICO|nr:sensor histidine kinase [Dermatophilus congolensis]SNV20582.1 Sensor histidine kinase desK [Dermatophilus congolensis]